MEIVGKLEISSEICPKGVFHWKISCHNSCSLLLTAAHCCSPSWKTLAAGFRFEGSSVEMFLTGFWGLSGRELRMWVGKKLRKKDAVLPPVEMCGMVGPGNPTLLPPSVSI